MRMPETLPGISPGTRISVDVFDTILLRKPLSERRRLFQIAKLFSNRIPSPQAKPTPELIHEARGEAQRLAYRALDAVDADGEVKIFDILERQLQLLGLPADLAALLLTIEVEVEAKSLVPNRPLIDWLQIQRSRGIPVIAISDTALSAVTLRSLIETVAGISVVDRVYTSADLGLTKRKGGIFKEVAAREGMEVRDLIHFGDDRLADLEQARAAGAQPTHLPRPAFSIKKRQLDVIAFEAGRYLATSRARRTSFTGTGRDEREAFGRMVLGPIIARYCARLWLYFSFADEPGGDSCALFCARGGLNLRAVFETFLERVQLPLAAARADLMVSRLVAVRGALLLNAPCAFEEIGREFGNAEMSSVARALAQSEIDFGPEWNGAYEPEAFARLMQTTEAGRQFRDQLGQQNALFAAHLESLTAGKGRLILCDTGLYGSTLRLLQAGFPERQWESVLFARCNYKGFASPHFAKTTGLIVERDYYDPLDTPSTILRYWQFIEHLFEPDLASVRTFTRAGDGSIFSNLETPDWRERLVASRSPLLHGVLGYLKDLGPENWFERLTRDEPGSWRALKRAFLFSASSDLPILSIGERSHDFGRDGKIKSLSSERASDLKGKLALLKISRWKEGLAAQEFPATRGLIQAALESGYSMRWLMRRIRS